MATKELSESTGPDDVTIIVPILQTARILDLFLTSLLLSTPAGPQLVLVDDGCSADTRAVIDRHRPALESKFSLCLIVHQHPRGDNVSANEALSTANGAVIVRLESDAIMQANWLSELLVPLCDQHVGVVSGVLIYPQSGGINHAGLTFYEHVGRHLWLNARPEFLPQAPFQVQCSTFGFSAIRKSTLLELGGFDEHYNQGYDDLDLALSVRKKSDLNILINPKAIAHHWEQSSGIHRVSSRKRNLAIFWSRWHDVAEDDLWQFLAPALKQKIANNKDVVAIDFHPDRRAAERLFSEAEHGGMVNITNRQNLAYLVDDRHPIQLPLALGADSMDEEARFLFLVDNIARLRGNRYFFDRRQHVRSDDLVVDLHANVVLASDIFMSAWPGDKIR